MHYQRGASPKLSNRPVVVSRTGSCNGRLGVLVAFARVARKAVTARAGSTAEGGGLTVREGSTGVNTPQITSAGVKSTSARPHQGGGSTKPAKTRSGPIPGPCKTLCGFGF